jgi:hypothetical protein
MLQRVCRHRTDQDHKHSIIQQRKEPGDAGEYIRIFGKAYGEADPCDSSNSIMQDIQLSPRNVRGKVEADAGDVLKNQ